MGLMSGYTVDLGDLLYLGNRPYQATVALATVPVYGAVLPASYRRDVEAVYLWWVLFGVTEHGYLGLCASLPTLWCLLGV
jgi:hypothetical protein